MTSAYLHLEEIEKAKEVARQAAKKNQINLTGYEIIASYYGKDGNYEKAIPILEEALQINPKSVSTLMLLGTAYLAKGTRVKSKSDLERGREQYSKLKEILKSQKENVTYLKQVENGFKSWMRTRKKFWNKNNDIV